MKHYKRRSKKTPELAAKHKKVVEFVKDRDAALLSMDRETFLAFVLKWQAWSGVNPDMLKSEALTEAIMHKMITTAKSLPLALRRESKAWLTAHGLKSGDDGEL